LRIELTNAFGTGTSMQHVVVTDHFGAELDGQPLSDLPVDVQVITHSGGHFHQDNFETQVRITWCVTGDLVDGECVDGGALLPGESAFMDMLVWTKLNPAGKQEYTCPGTYEMNSGATAKWLDENGVNCAPLADCPSTAPIDVTASRVGAGTATATATSTPTADPPGSGTPTLTATRTATATKTPKATKTPRATKTPTRTPTQTPTMTPSTTPTATPTGTPTPAATPTPEWCPGDPPATVLINEVPATVDRWATSCVRGAEERHGRSRLAERLVPRR
jgi:hypothetical protein